MVSQQTFRVTFGPSKRIRCKISRHFRIGVCFWNIQACSHATGARYFHRCRLRAVILWLRRVKSGPTRRIFANCHTGRGSILLPFASATSKYPPVTVSRVPTVEKDHMNPRRAVMERFAMRNGRNRAGMLWTSQSRLLRLVATICCLVFMI